MASVANDKSQNDFHPHINEWMGSTSPLPFLRALLEHRLMIVRAHLKSSHEMTASVENEEEGMMDALDQDVEEEVEETLSITTLLQALDRNDIPMIKSFLQREIEYARSIIPGRMEIFDSMSRFEEKTSKLPGARERQFQRYRGDLELLELLARMFDACYYK